MRTVDRLQIEGYTDQGLANYGDRKIAASYQIPDEVYSYSDMISASSFHLWRLPEANLLAVSLGSDVLLFFLFRIPRTHQPRHCKKRDSRNASGSNVENLVRICRCIRSVVGRTTLGSVGECITVGCRTSSDRIGYHQITRLRGSHPYVGNSPYDLSIIGDRKPRLRHATQGQSCGPYETSPRYRCYCSVATG